MTKTYTMDRRERSFADIESMSPGLRECVHEYGYAIVHACLESKVSDPSRIRNLVREIWEGARQPAQRRTAGGTIDWLLLQAGAGISAATLFRILADNGFALVTVEPSPQMIAASMAEVSGFNKVVTKSEKHRLRLRAAIKAGLERVKIARIKAA